MIFGVVGDLSEFDPTGLEFVATVDFEQLDDAILLGPLPYLSFDDSPFALIDVSEFYLEDFEDGVLDTPFVSASGNGLTVFGPGGSVDSVDADDGAIDGSGTGGRSLVATPPIPSITFDFEPIGGMLPTHVGVVWTDGQPTLPPNTTFEVFDGNGGLLVTETAQLADDTNMGTTFEDRFFGAIHEEGISRITIANDNAASFGIEVDHLQYGYNSLLGDVNCDGVVDLLDVQPFVDLITSGDFSVKADINQDGAVDLLDVAPFVELLVAG